MACERGTGKEIGWIIFPLQLVLLLSITERAGSRGIGNKQHMRRKDPEHTTAVLGDSKELNTGNQEFSRNEHRCCANLSSSTQVPLCMQTLVIFFVSLCTILRTFGLRLWWCCVLAQIDWCWREMNEQKWWQPQNSPPCVAPANSFTGTRPCPLRWATATRVLSTKRLHQPEKHAFHDVQIHELYPTIMPCQAVSQLCALT